MCATLHAQAVRNFTRQQVVSSLYSKHMSFARVWCAQPAYPQAHLVDVEADLSKGLHAFSIVGLPDKAVEEARDRVSAAIKHSGRISPKAHNRKVVVSLAPAHLKKEGSHFDLAIALAYLKAANEINFDASGKLFVGELALDGTVRPVRGVLAIALCAREVGYTELYVPSANAREAALIKEIEVYGVHDLTEAIKHLDHTPEEEERDTELGSKPARTTVRLIPTPTTEIVTGQSAHTTDFADVRGQASAKRGLMIAAAGGHNIALYGPPGTGKTLLARAFTGILPPLSFDAALEATAIHSLAGHLDGDLITHPPFRAPHHTASHVSLVGGGVSVRPGEVTLAHRGVLFLDEFPEFDRRCLDALRQPLEDRVVTVSRAKGTVEYPANFILIAAMNPTPLGGAEDPSIISERDRLKYQRKISGPIIDRIDMWIEVAHVDHAELSEKRAKDSESARVRVLVDGARALQHERFGDTETLNSDMGVQDLDRHITLTLPVQQLLADATKKLSLSPRAYHRVIKLARTIADLDDAKHITEPHLLEALQYRPRNVFG